MAQEFSRRMVDIKPPAPRVVKATVTTTTPKRRKATPKPAKPAAVSVPVTLPASSPASPKSARKSVARFLIRFVFALVILSALALTGALVYVYYLQR